MFACAAIDDFSLAHRLHDRPAPFAGYKGHAASWQEIEERVIRAISRLGRASVAMRDLDPSGDQVQPADVPSKPGRRRVPRCIKIALLYFNHSLDESD